jgi:SAM-dependent methyltransferase
MTDQEARYDRVAAGYAEWWSPIHRPATLRLLDEADGAGGRATHVLDVGCGTGAMVQAAAERWPAARVTGLDVSEGMLALARDGLGAVPRDVARRVRYVRATADALPFEDATFDVVMTAFMLQLVPSRFRALREARRVLKPGGLLAYVTWLEGGMLAADAAYDAALAAFGFEPRAQGGSNGDLVSPEAAVAQLRRAGFSGARAHAGELAHRFTPEGYLGFVSRFDDEDLFASIDTDTRQALEADLLARLAALPPDGLEMRLPIVYATGRRAGGA